MNDRAAASGTVRGNNGTERQWDSGTDMSADTRRVEAVADVEVAVEAEVGPSEVEVQLRAGYKQGQREGQGKGARGCADEKAARWLCPVAPSRY